MGHYAWDGTYNEDGSDHMVWVADAADKAEENFRLYGDSRGPGYKRSEKELANGYTLGNSGYGYDPTNPYGLRTTEPTTVSSPTVADALLKQQDKLKADGVVKAAAADLSNLTPSKDKKTSKWGWWNR